MAQNYLRADVGEGLESAEVPIGDPGKDELVICFDGQLGNARTLAEEFGVPDGPFLEERLLQTVYERFGTNICTYLSDAVFAFVISDGEKFFAARDLLGIKTLFYGRKDDCLYLASELKALACVTEDINEFPPGMYMESNGELKPFGELPSEPPEQTHDTVGKMCEKIRDIIDRSFDARVPLTNSTAALLSGGMDSSVICALASKRWKEQYGSSSRLRTFAIGVGESLDIQGARLVAKHIDSDHHEMIVTLEDLLAVLPDVIYHLESFDPSLVRSAVANFLISRRASKQGIDTLLSGEGGDEVFCGYSYLKGLPAEEIFSKQIECLGYLHNNASLRLDRMNQCHSIRVIAPLISGELLGYALTIPAEWKIYGINSTRIEKWIFRKAYEDFLPLSITFRTKQEFSQGSGCADVLQNHFEAEVSGLEFAEAKAKYPIIRSKEELYYFSLFVQYFGAEKAVDTVGQWISL